MVVEHDGEHMLCGTQAVYKRMTASTPGDEDGSPRTASKVGC